GAALLDSGARARFHIDVAPRGRRHHPGHFARLPQNRRWAAHWTKGHKPLHRSSRTFPGPLQAPRKKAFVTSFERSGSTPSARKRTFRHEPPWLNTMFAWSLRETRCRHWPNCWLASVQLSERRARQEHS